MSWNDKVLNVELCFVFLSGRFTLGLFKVSTELRLELFQVNAAGRCHYYPVVEAAACKACEMVSACM